MKHYYSNILHLLRQTPKKMVQVLEKEGGDITFADMVLPKMESSKIQQFFAGSSIFITGATGFLGKLLMEKILRNCPDTEKVYILIREKKGKSIGKRFEELLDNVFFDRLKREQPKFVNKIELITGDCTLPDLGLDPKDRLKIINSVNCIFHCAATVRFDEKIRNSTYINVRATRDILRLSKELKHLKSIVYVSTAFSNCIRDDVEEKFYKPTISGDKLLTLVNTLSDDLLDNITPILLGKWPNTYAFTKAIAEEIVEVEGRGLPLAVVRPSIVIATSKEPVAGWIDNMYGATGVTVGVALGLIRTLHCKLDCLADLVPADYVINCTIASAWYAGTLKELNINKEITEEANCTSEETNKSDVLIYNYVSSPQKAITWRQFMKYAERHLKQVPSPLQVWHYFFILNSNYFLYLLCILLFHRIPAYIVDFLAICVGKQPMLVKGYQKIEKFLNVLAYFATRQWNFTNNNTQSLWKKLNEEDQRLFDFDMDAFDWDSYFFTYARGGRVYLLKDPLETLPQGRIKYLKLQVAHYTLMLILFLGFVKLMMILWGCVI